MVLRIRGRVSRTKRCQGPAPSIRAASTRSGGIACRPVSRMIMVKPAIFQTTMTTMMAKAVSNSAIRFGGRSARPSATMARGMKPASTLASQIQSSEAEARPTTTGRKMIVR